MVDTPNITASEMMNGFLLHADVEDNVTHVARLLSEKNANAVIIRERGVPKGIVTSKDVVRGVVTYENNPDDIPAKEIMTSPIVALEHNEDWNKARNLMLDQSVRKIPVTKGYDVIGVIVQTDIIRELSK